MQEQLLSPSGPTGSEPKKDHLGFLLPQRFEDVSAQNKLADIFLPGLSAALAALGKGITAPQRQDVVVRAVGSSLATASGCAAHQGVSLEHRPPMQGTRLIPVVAVDQSAGVWEREAGQSFCKLRAVQLLDWARLLLCSGASGLALSVDVLN